MSARELPLTEKFRPTLAKNFVGQPHLWNSEAPLRKLIEKGMQGNLLFWGPPGVGKTTLANIIADMIGSETRFLSAVSCSVKDLRAVFEESKSHVALKSPPILMFLDEVHRLSKNQQDVLLPQLESGKMLFIGATSEDPSYAVNRAVLSRALTFEFKHHSPDLIVQTLRSALTDFYPQHAPSANLEALNIIAHQCDGDLRQGLNLLEALVLSELIAKTSEQIINAMPNLKKGYNRSGTERYTLASALIKSIRASDPDAAIYYLARMLHDGEDPRFIARRIFISASEDVGNTSPTGLLMAQAAQQASETIGMPEIRIIFAQVVTYLASCPKSNRSYEAINQAMEVVKQTGAIEVPKHLRNASNEFHRQQGYGQNYIYSHDNPNHRMPCLPDEISNKIFYSPTDQGTERILKQFLEQRAKQST
jgi:putative ATPase